MFRYRAGQGTWVFRPGWCVLETVLAGAEECRLGFRSNRRWGLHPLSHQFANWCQLSPPGEPFGALPHQCKERGGSGKLRFLQARCALVVRLSDRACRQKRPLPKERPFYWNDVTIPGGSGKLRFPRPQCVLETSIVSAEQCRLVFSANRRWGLHPFCQAP